MAWVTTLVLSLLLGCGKKPTETANGGGATEETNGSLAGNIALPNGSTPMGIRVYARTEKYVKDTSRVSEGIEIADALTDNKGHFQIDSLAPGKYSVEMKNTVGEGAIALGTVISKTVTELPTKTLSAVGSIEGTLQTPATTSTQYVQIFGLNRVAKVDSLGHYTFTDLPPGPIQIKAVTSNIGLAYALPNVVTVVSGKTTPVDTLHYQEFQKEDYSLWAHSQKIIVNTKAAGILDTLKSFPLLVRLDSSNFDFTTTNGEDIRFAGMQNEHLPYQIEQFDAAHKTATLWVGLDSLFGNVNTQFITLYSGKTGVANFSQPSTIFNGYTGVWHLQNTDFNQGAYYYPDASPHGANAKGNAISQKNEALMGSAALFTGRTSAETESDSILRPDHQISISAWFKTKKTDIDGGEMVSMGNVYGLRITKYGLVHFFVFHDSTWTQPDIHPDSGWDYVQTTDLGIKDNQWHHAVGVYDGAQMVIYVDGKETTAKSPSSKKIAYKLGTTLKFGRFGTFAKAGISNPNTDFFGSIDEVRISTTPISAARIKADYNSQKPNSILLNFVTPL